MQLVIEGVPRDLIEIKAFRDQYGLPSDFRVALFEPKDYAGLGSIEKRGADLNILRQKVLDALPPHQTPQQWLRDLPTLEMTFRQELEAINDRIGLHPPEIEFAAAGFRDSMQAWIYALMQAQLAHQTPPSFMRAYADWLHETIRVTQFIHDYKHQSATWKIQIITHVYGRVGLIVAMPDQTIYVYDASLACPAEGYMVSLLAEVAARIAGS